MIGRLVVHIAYVPDGDELKMHVRHEAPDGLWDSRDTTVGGADEVQALDRVLSRVAGDLREVLRMTEARS